MWLQRRVSLVTRSADWLPCRHLPFRTRSAPGRTTIEITEAWRTNLARCGKIYSQRWASSVGRDGAADMHLSDHDLKQLDEDYLRGLPAESLRSLSGKLLADLKEAHDRLNQNPSNSSRPPSTRAPWEKDDSGVDEKRAPEAYRSAFSRRRGRGLGALFTRWLGIFFL